jgi:hypothetical protein
VFAVLLGILVALLSFVPRVTIVSTGSVDAENPFSVGFTITNTSPMPVPLNDVNVRVSIGQSLTEPLPFKPPRKFTSADTAFTFQDWVGHKLQIDESFTITLVHLIALGKVPPYVPARLSGADVALIVEYRPWILPWHVRRIQRFVTARQSDGKLYWYSIPLE